MTDGKMKLTAPADALHDGTIQLTPLTYADAEELEVVCDLDGFVRLDYQAPPPAPGVDPCKWLHMWGVSRASYWVIDFDLPTALVQACFATRLLDSLGNLAGVVGFNSTSVLGVERINVYYWTSPGVRGKGVAARAVRTGTPWALKTFGVGEALIHPVTDASKRVAEKASFRLTDDKVRGFPVYLWP